MSSLRQLFLAKPTIKEDLQAEMKRRASRRQSMLRAFELKGSLTTAELNRFGTGCSSRLKELRRSGYVIKVRYEKPGQYNYIFMGQKDEA